MPPRISSKRRAADLSIVAATIVAVVTAWAFIPKGATSTPSADAPTEQAFGSSQPASLAPISETPATTVTTTPALAAQTRDTTSTQSPNPPPISPPRRTQAAPPPATTPPATTPPTTTPPPPMPPTTERSRPPRN